MDRDTSSDGERRVPVDVHAAVSDGDHAGCDGVMRLTAVKGVSCSHSAERQHLENTHHVSNLSGENVDPSEQPRHSELLQGRSASEIASLHGRGDNDFSDGVMESDSQLDRTATTVVTTKDFTAERDGRNRCYFDVVGSTCHQVWFVLLIKVFRMMMMMMMIIKYNTIRILERRQLHNLDCPKRGMSQKGVIEINKLHTVR